MSGPDLTTLAPGDAIPADVHVPDTIQLFLYSAALWNAHRIHFDLPYATDVERYPGLVVPGPLMGDWLAQCVEGWLGDAGVLVAFEYSNRQAAYAGEKLVAAGKVVGLDRARSEATLELELRNAAGDILVPGRAVVRFGAVLP
jgi:3-methylfumaryl-CoA hydratase